MNCTTSTSPSCYQSPEQGSPPLNTFTEQHTSIVKMFHIPRHLSKHQALSPLVQPPIHTTPDYIIDRLDNHRTYQSYRPHQTQQKPHVPNPTLAPKPPIRTSGILPFLWTMHSTPNTLFSPSSSKVYKYTNIMRKTKPISRYVQPFAAVRHRRPDTS